MGRPLEAHLGYWLRYVSNHVSHAFSLRLAGRGVTVAEWVLLKELHECEGTAPSELAERLGMTRGAISKLVDRLVAKSLVVRTVSAGDRRSQHLALTKKARVLVPALTKLADENDSEFFGHLRADERAALEGAMKEIVRRHNMKGVPVE